MTTKLEHFRQLLTDSERAVVFTGAGISTESGIPDFRGPGGLWTKYKPIEFQQFVSSADTRQRSWQQWFEHGKAVLEARPNAGHRAVARLVEQGRVSAVITQNVDNLHQESGVPDDRIIELHGNASYAKCLECSEIHRLEAIEQQFRESKTVGPCAKCGGIVKLGTISFGQAMPDQPMQLAEEETLACDLFLVLGSSLSVYPAAAFPEVAARNGARLVIINQQPTDLDPLAEVVIQESIGEVMSAVVNVGVDVDMN